MIKDVKYFLVWLWGAATVAAFWLAVSVELAMIIFGICGVLAMLLCFIKVLIDHWEDK